MRRKMKQSYVAIDQYGQVHHIGHFAPRAELLRMLGRQHADKIYRTIGGKTQHVGWKIAGLWLDVFKLLPLKDACND